MNFERIYIDKASQKSKVAQRFKTLFPQEMIEYVDEPPLSRKKQTGFLTSSEFDRSKKNIFITEFKGQFFKRCPGTHQKMACCNYFVLNLGLQCNMNCSYCYLQSFINSPVMTIYSNIEQALQELDQMTSEFKGLSFRVGTGEVIDSLSLDPLTLYSRELITFFKDRPHLTLEFKTKSDLVDQFLDCDHAGNVIVSWSINPEVIIKSEEHLTASLNERLQAAKKCLDKKFKVSFHIDPIIWHPNWKESYAGLVDQITSQFSPEQVPYVSLGALRFQTEQRWMMKERFNLDSYVNQAEMFEGPDKKLRYDQNLRNEMFQFILDRFKLNRSTNESKNNETNDSSINTMNSAQWNVFLCMETPETWLSTYESMPKKVPGLENLFEARKSL